MNRSPLFLICVALSLTVLSACSGRDAAVSRYLPGGWICNVNDGNFLGTDTVFLSPDSTFREIKGLFYSSHDSGFEFSTGVKIEIKGVWCLTGDTLGITYDMTSLNIIVSKDSFHLVATGKEADTGKLAAVREGMFQDLQEHLTGLIREEYASLPSGKIVLGRIEHVNADNLLLDIGGNRVIMTRCQ